MVAVEIAVDIPLGPEAASEAREYIRRLKGAMPDRKFDALTIVISEVVTNSVVHSGSDERSNISLKVAVGEGHARVEIHDDGFGFERPASPMRASESEGGWGLYLMDTLAEEWGVSRSGGRAYGSRSNGEASGVLGVAPRPLRRAGPRSLGRGDMATEEDFGREIQAAVKHAGGSSLVLDLTGVKFMAARGVRTISDATRAFRENGGTVKAAVEPGEVAEILTLTGAAWFLKIYPDASSALKR